MNLFERILFIACLFIVGCSSAEEPTIYLCNECELFELNSRKRDLYTSLIRDGFTFNGNTDYESFSIALADSARALKLHTIARKKGYKLGDFSTFYEYYGGKTDTIYKKKIIEPLKIIYKKDSILFNSKIFSQTHDSWILTILYDDGTYNYFSTKSINECQRNVQCGVDEFHKEDDISYIELLYDGGYYKKSYAYRFPYKGMKKEGK